MIFYDICECARIAYLLAYTPQNIFVGFRVSGIFPYNENIFQDFEFVSSSVTDHLVTTSDPSSPSTPNADFWAVTLVWILTDKFC